MPHRGKAHDDRTLRTDEIGWKNQLERRRLSALSLNGQEFPGPGAAAAVPPPGTMDSPGPAVPSGPGQATGGGMPKDMPGGAQKVGKGLGARTSQAEDTTEGQGVAARGAESAGQVMKTAGKTAEVAGKGVETAGKAAEVGGKAAEMGGKGMQAAGKGIQAAGKGVDAAGGGMISAGAGLSSTGLGAIAGVPLMALGGLTKGIGMGTQAAGAGTTAAGKGVEAGGKAAQQAGKGMQKAGQGVSRAGGQARQAGAQLGSTPMPGGGGLPGSKLAGGALGKLAGGGKLGGEVQRTVEEMSEAGKRAATIVSGGGVAGLAKAAADDAKKSLQNIAMAKDKVKAIEQEAAKNFKNWFVMPNIFSIWVDLISFTGIVLLPFKMAFLHIYWFLAEGGTKGTVKYNLAEKLSLICFDILAFIFVMTFLAAIFAIVGLAQCLLDPACAFDLI